MSEIVEIAACAIASAVEDYDLLHYPYEKDKGAYQRLASAAIEAAKFALIKADREETTRIALEGLMSEDRMVRAAVAIKLADRLIR